MSTFWRTVSLLLYILAKISARPRQDERPYEFSFNLVDFQHRHEKKDAEGIITGEYGFITADGVYHETGYATDKNGDFLITKMKNRKITSLADAREIFKDKPEAAEKLVELLARSCADCKIFPKETNVDEFSTIEPDSRENSPSETTSPTLTTLMQILTSDLQTDDSIKDEPENSTDPSTEENSGDEGTENSLSNISTFTEEPDDLYYRFNYTISSHDHHEDGYRSGRKDGGYRTQSESGVDTRVKYLSNEFGHQPNISFVRRTTSDADQILQGYNFRWYRQ